MHEKKNHLLFVVNLLVKKTIHLYYMQTSMNALEQQLDVLEIVLIHLVPTTVHAKQALHWMLTLYLVSVLY